MKYQLHHYYTSEEISALKAGRKSFEIIPSTGMFLWLHDESYQYKFRVINGYRVKLVDRVLLGDNHS